MDRKVSHLEARGPLTPGAERMRARTGSASLRLGCTSRRGPPGWTMDCVVGRSRRSAWVFMAERVFASRGRHGMVGRERGKVDVTQHGYTGTSARRCVHSPESSRWWRLNRELAPTRFYLTLLSAFSTLALILAAVGLYGVVAYSVSRRTREIGIRMALGARGDDVVGMVVREGVVPAVAGVALGILGSVWSGGILGSLLYEVDPQDPVTLATVTAIFVSVALVATLLPSLRASRVPPASALRTD